jgi:hypothetical protein
MGFIEKPGEYNARVIDWKVLDSFTNWDETSKDAEKLPEFSDPAPELAVMFGTDHGTVIARLHIKGYVQWDDLTEEAQNSGKYKLVEFHDRAYACVEKNGKLTRVESPEKTKDAQNFINQFFTSAGQGEAESLKAAMDSIVEGKTEINIKVDMEKYRDSNPLPKVTRFRPYKEIVTDEFGG